YELECAMHLVAHPSGDETNTSSLLLNETRRFAPATTHDEAGERLTFARGDFTFAQRIRQRGWIARVADHESRNWFPAVGNFEQLDGLMRIEPRHLMHKQPLRGSFEGQIGDGGAGIVEGVAVGFAGARKSHLGDRNSQHGRMPGPVLVEFDKRAYHFGVILGVVSRSYQEGPRLFVAAGGRPARGFEQAAKYIRTYRLIGEGAGAPTVAEQVVDGVLCDCRLLHEGLLRLRSKSAPDRVGPLQCPARL